MALKLNETAPDFTLPGDNGQDFQLGNQDRLTLLVFYPGDDTPVCTAQLCDYRDGIEVFKDLDVDVVGISTDDVASHRRFREKYDLPFALLSDTDHAVASSYGAYSKLYGMKRAIFLVGPDRKLLYKHIESLPIFRRKKEELLEEIKKARN